MSELRKTPLHGVHKQSGAKLVPFGGWEMPVEYSGIVAEHTAVRTAAGLFDVSHMGEFEVSGPGSLAFLQRVTANDAAKLAVGQAQYSALPTEQGAPVDDVIVYRRGDARYLVVVNAANLEKDWAWLQRQEPRECELRDLSDGTALLALQGPRAQAILQPLTRLPLHEIGFYRFAEGEVCGRQAVVARTGYTGEDGFEIFLAPDDASPVWKQLVETGGPQGLLEAGLGARDTLRLEARMLLYGNDMDESTSLLEAGLGWILSFDERKGDWLGRSVLAKQKAEGVPRRLAGFELTERGIARHGYPVLLDGQPSGAVTSGSWSPTLSKSIGLAYLPRERASEGSALAVEVRGRPVEARVVKTPFYKRAR